jgi:hypothetical protein
MRGDECLGPRSRGKTRGSPHDGWAISRKTASPSTDGDQWEGNVNDIEIYLDQRLHSIAEEGLIAAKIAVSKVTAENASQLANSRIWFLYDKAIKQEFVNALNKAAGLIWESAGSAAPRYADKLEKLGSDLCRQIILWREKRRQSHSAYGEAELLNQHIARVRDDLAKAQQTIVADFDFGVVDGKQMARPEAAETNPLILRPAFMGMGIDLPKTWNWLKARWRRWRDQMN